MQGSEAGGGGMSCCNHHVLEGIAPEQPDSDERFVLFGS